MRCSRCWRNASAPTTASRSPFSKHNGGGLPGLRARRGRYRVLETGLGGRLDTTNVIRRPAVTAINPGLARPPGVSRRHRRGDCRREGRHLEGWRAAVIGPQLDAAAAIIEVRARASPRRSIAGVRSGAATPKPLSDPLPQAGEAGVGAAVGASGCAIWLAVEPDLPLPVAAGAHQIVNAAWRSPV